MWGRGGPPALTGLSEAPSTATRRGVSSCSMDVASVNAHSSPPHPVFPFSHFPPPPPPPRGSVFFPSPSSRATEGGFFFWALGRGAGPFSKKKTPPLWGERTG